MFGTSNDQNSSDNAILIFILIALESSVKYLQSIIQDKTMQFHISIL